MSKNINESNASCINIFIHKYFCISSVVVVVVIFYIKIQYFVVIQMITKDKTKDLEKKKL